MKDTFYKIISYQTSNYIKLFLRYEMIKLKKIFKIKYNTNILIVKLKFKLVLSKLLQKQRINFVRNFK